MLRAWSSADAPVVVEAASDPLISLISTVPARPDDDAVQAFLARQADRAASGTGWSWAVADAGHDRALGQVGLWPLAGGRGTGDSRRASVGYWVAPSARGAGVARRALEVVSAWGLGVLGLARLELYVEPWNAASWRSAERAGYVREGLLRSWQEVGGERRDMIGYARTRERPAVGTTDLDDVVARELRLLEPAVRNDPDQVRALLHEGFREHGASGTVWDRTTITRATAGSTVPVRASDVVAHPLGPDAVPVTYRSEVSGQAALRSSVWVREGGAWLMLFHQGTPLTG